MWGIDYRAGAEHGGWQVDEIVQVDSCQLERGVRPTAYVPGLGDYPPFPRFTGRVTAIVDLFETTGEHDVSFTCADYASLLAVYDGYEQLPVGAGEMAGARITRICDNAGFDKPRRFDAGTVALQETTLAKNSLDEAGMVCDTELGSLFCDAAGTLQFYDRNGVLTRDEFTAVQAVFGEIPPEICYQAIQLASDLDKVKNVVSISNVGGTAVTVEDPTSRGMYGAQTFRRLDLIHVDPAQSTAIAQRHLDFYAYAANRITGFQPLVTGNTLPLLLPLGLLWRVEIRRRATGFQVIAELQIEAIAESITADEWTMTLTTFSAGAIFAAAKWDTDRWDTTGRWGY
jgi:hypothetical protein